MKSSTLQTLVVVVALTVSGIPSLAVSEELYRLPVSPADLTDTHRTTAAMVPGPFYALNRLNAENPVAQAMTDQELKAVEGAFFGIRMMVVGYDYSQRVEECVTFNFSSISSSY